MFKIRHLIQLYVFLMSSFLALSAGLCQTPNLRREAYVVSAYERFYSLLYMLSANERFLGTLTEVERQQFMKVAEVGVKNALILGPAARPGAYDTSKVVDFKLNFSSNSAEFILSPGEPERTAKMAVDIWFNLNILNNPKVSFNILDAFQILFHEFGHKVLNKNQIQIDSISAKMKSYLRGFYTESALHPTLKVSSLVLPYLHYDNGPIDYQFEPILIVENQGKAQEFYFDVSKIPTTRALTEAPGTQGYTRTLLKPLFEMRDGGLVVSWNMNTRSTLILAEKFNYMDLVWNPNKANPVEVIDPITNQQILVYRINASMLDNIKNGQMSLKGQYLGIDNINFIESPFRNDQSRWLQDLKLTSQSSTRDTYSAIIQTTEPIRSVRLMVENDGSFFKVKGAIDPYSSDTYRISFDIPNQQLLTRSLKLVAIELNEKVSWNLPQQIRIEAAKVSNSQKPRPSNILLFDGTNWVGVREFQGASPEVESIKMRFLFKDKFLKIEQIRTDWASMSAIGKDGFGYGQVLERSREIVDKNAIKTFYQDDFLVAEFELKTTTEKRSDVVSKQGVVTKDSLIRTLTEFRVLDSNFNLYEANLKGSVLIPPVFMIKPKIMSCQKIFL